MNGLTYSSFQELVRRLVLSGKNLYVKETTEGHYQILDQEESHGVFCQERLPHCPIIGCDLRNYSGMVDVEQFIFGQTLDRYVLDALRFSGTPYDKVELSGTGDGVLIGFRDTNMLQEALSCAVKLWADTQTCVSGCDNEARGLRVAIAFGPCLFGSEGSGRIKMQGLGLIDVSRIMSCDTEQHFLISERFIQKLRDACPNKVSLTGDRIAQLELGPKRSGKFKKNDAKKTTFFNVVATITDPSGAVWRVGTESERGLHTPGS